MGKHRHQRPLIHTTKAVLRHCGDVSLAAVKPSHGFFCIERWNSSALSREEAQSFLAFLKRVPSHCHADELLALDRPAVAESVSDRGAVAAAGVPGAPDDAVAARAAAAARGHVPRMVFRPYLVLVLKRTLSISDFTPYFRKFLQLNAILFLNPPTPRPFLNSPP